MRIIRGLDPSKPAYAGATVLTIGNFDGMHLGHRELVRRVVEEAKRESLPGGLMTFDPHPLKVLFPEKPFHVIFDLEDRLEVAGHLGLDFFVVQPFDRALSQLEPEAFFKKYLVDNLRLKSLFVGHDFNFGKNRAGTLEVLESLCRRYQINLTILPAVKVGGETVSSTKIREAVKLGEMEKTRAFLGRPFYLNGMIVKGDERGRRIGFPTANLQTSAPLLPRHGVYFTAIEIGGVIHKGVTNVGVNPTFKGEGDKAARIETHILNFNRDVYGEPARLRFFHFLRPETRFDSVDALVKQIKNDVKKAEEFNWSENLSSLN